MKKEVQDREATWTTLRNTALNHVWVSWKLLALSAACGRKELCTKSRLEQKQPCQSDQCYSADPMVLEATVMEKKISVDFMARRSERITK